MKRTIAIFLVLCLCATLCACGQSNNQPIETEPIETEPKKIEINNYNVEDYLAVNVSSYVSNRTRCAKIEIYPTQGGDFSNTKITLSLGKALYVTGIKNIKGAKYTLTGPDYYKHYLVDFTLPADGRYEIDIAFEVLFDTDEPITSPRFENASGTFIPR